MSSQQQALSDRTLVVSGGSRGIGLAIALGAGKQGANAVSWRRPPNRIRGCRARCTRGGRHRGGRRQGSGGGRRCAPRRGRATRRRHRGGTFGGVDICVNNASAIATESTEQLSAKKFHLMQAINIRGTFLLTKACLPHLRKSSNPHVLMLAPAMQHEPRMSWCQFVHTDLKYGMTAALVGAIRRCRHRLQLPVAADLHRDGRGVEHGRWPEHDVLVSNPGNHGGRRCRDPAPPGR